MLERAGAAFGGQVLGLLADEAPVGELPGGGDQVAGEVGAVQRVEQRTAGGGGGDQDGGGCGQGPKYQ
ncbi:hypothetical protein ACWC9T_32320 [Kitasatospora sp. NPDC001159]